MTRPTEAIPKDVDISLHARRGVSVPAWLVLVAVTIAGIVMLVWAFQVMFDDLDARSWGPPLIAVGGFMLLLVPVIVAWFEVGRMLRLRRAELKWPGSFVVPIVITMQLPKQVDSAAAALGRRLYMPGTGYGLLVGDAAGVRILSGWAFATDLTIPRASLRAVELGQYSSRSEPRRQSMSFSTHPAKSGSRSCRYERVDRFIPGNGLRSSAGTSTDWTGSST